MLVSDRMIKKMGGLLMLTSLLAGCSAGEGVVVSVHNSLDFARDGEMVEVPLSKLQKVSLKEGQKYVVVDAATKAQVPYQLTYDGMLIFPATVGAGATSSYTVTAGQPEAMDTVACGRFYPERLDDIAWENDKAAYRAYGPALQRRQEQAYGYDVFTKSVSYPVVEKRYAMELDSAARAQIAVWRKEGQKEKADSLVKIISYHVDHGNGMDVYNVGPTLGGGASALMDGEELIYPYCFKDYEILDNGPLRFTMKLTYNPLKVKGDTAVVETRVISLDKGSYLNRTVLTYSGLSNPTTLASGLVLHSQNPNGYVFNADDRFIAYADSTNNATAGHGVIYVGAAFPKQVEKAYVQLFPEPKKDAIGHVLATSLYEPNSSYVYYWGSGWSKGGVQDMDAWTTYLKDFSKQLASPLEVEVK